MSLPVHPGLQERFPGLQAIMGHVYGVNTGTSSPELKQFSEEVFSEVRQRYTLASLKDVPILRAYRDFFWRIGIDPTKVRPAAEALIRRILAGSVIPRINNVVDSYNLASIKTEIALAAFDLDKLTGELMMREAKAGERFLGIGMSEPSTLAGTEIVISDAEKLIAIYPHRDAETSKVSPSTSKVLILACGVPGIEISTLKTAVEVALSYIEKFCGGKRISE